MKKIKVAISQRIIPHYRISVFKNLSNRKKIDLTVFYGKGMKTGSQSNATKICGFKKIKLFTLKLNYRGIYKSKQLRVWHPTLFFHLIKGNFDVVIVEPSTNFYNNIFTFLYCKLFNKKFIWHDAGSVPKNERPIFRKLIDPFLSIFINNSDAYLTYNSFADKSLQRDFKIDSRLIFRAQNTVDIAQINMDINKYEKTVKNFKIELGLVDHKLLLYIGGVEKRKKINYLIKTVAKLNKSGIRSKCLIVGDGPDKDYLIKSISKEEKKHTLFFGKKIKSAVKYILASDLVLLPSSGGLSVVSAFACGKPFVGSVKIEHGGIKDYVDHGINGFLFEEDNLFELYDYCYKILTNKKLYKKMSIAALQKSTELTVENMVNGFEKAVKFVTDET